MAIHLYVMKSGGTTAKKESDSFRYAASLQGHFNSIRDLQFSEDGELAKTIQSEGGKPNCKYLASAGQDGYIRIWKVMIMGDSEQNDQ